MSIMLPTTVSGSARISGNRFNLRRTPRWFLLISVGIAGVACGDPAGTEPPVFGPPLVGSAHVPYSLGTSVALLDDHTACTIDTYETKVDCVDRSGSRVGRFGSSGEGPGEFLRPGHLVRGIDGTVGLTDSSRGWFLAFTRTGELVAETRLATPTPVFVPISPFGKTVTGTYVTGYGVGAMTGRLGNAIAAAEISLATGEVIREWRPSRVPTTEECGIPYFGFPVVAGGEDGAWVFLACSGHMVFLRPSGEATVLQAPTYVEETPSDRDVADYRTVLDEFGKRIGSTADFSTNVTRYAESRRLYYLARGQETFDERGRLWISTRRGRDASSFVDVYLSGRYMGTVQVRDRMIDFDVIDSTMAVLVERRAGPDDPDGVPDRGIDWYDIRGFPGVPR